MRTMLPVLCCLATLSASVLPAAAELLAPFKDGLFALPRILETGEDGTRTVFDYQEMRDINGRDEIPERRARPEYVDLSVRRQQQELARGPIRYFAVGTVREPRFVVAYVHGQGGNRRQGVDDFSFGGNFNRIKNLVARNGGLYLSPDVTDFEETGAGRIASLLNDHAANGVPVFLACGSAGGAICWQIARTRLVPGLGGLLLLGSHWDEGFLASAAFRDRVPLHIAHGARDRVFPVTRQQAFFRSIRAAAPDYPVRFSEFAGGTHGTPIRMSDWRTILNWMAAQR